MSDAISWPGTESPVACHAAEALSIGCELAPLFSLSSWLMLHLHYLLLLSCRTASSDFCIYDIIKPPLKPLFFHPTLVANPFNS
jgi:hypothetical protein